ncbi:MAG: AAA family ATPase [archaeon GB-1845-036]|nr:AAA family ATPase [Candidatus Culexmicrobium thermophilum]
MSSISKIHIKNFLSLKDVEVELGKLNIMVGPNASGKSNIAKALILLRNHVREGFPTISGYRNFKDIAFNFDETAKISFEVEATLENCKIQYSLNLTVNGYFEQAKIDGKVVLSQESEYSYTPKNSLLTVEGKMESVSSPYQQVHMFNNRLLFRSLLSFLPSNAIKELHELAKLLRNITVHSFSPERIRASSNISVHPIIGYYGENLARTLLYLYLEDRKTFNSIENAFRSFIPEVEEIIPHIEGSTVELWLRVKGLSEPLKPANISDGTLRMLALITILYSKSSLAVFEEPENCVHPYLLEAFVNLTYKAPCQVMITTHSPYLLDHVKPEDVYIVNKFETSTIIRKLERMDEMNAVRKLLEEGGTLGEAWYSGLIHGVPRAE